MTTTAVGSATDTTTTTPTSGTGSTGSTGSSDAFRQALEASLVEARSVPTTTLGAMVAGALDAQRFPAVSSAPVRAAMMSATSAGSGTSGSLRVPDELRAYGNGHIPADALEKIGIKSHRLWAPAAESFQQMRAAAAADGVDIGVTDSYRSYDEQVDLVRRKGLYSQGGLAAKPGTSPHGWGMALDVDVTPEGLAWLRANASRYGFVECVPREPWHWEYRP